MDNDTTLLGSFVKKGRLIKCASAKSVTVLVIGAESICPESPSILLLFPLKAIDSSKDRLTT